VFLLAIFFLLLLVPAVNCRAAVRANYGFGNHLSFAMVSVFTLGGSGRWDHGSDDVSNGDERPRWLCLSM